MTFLPCYVKANGCRLNEKGGSNKEGKFHYARYNSETGAIDWHRYISYYESVGGAISMRDSGVLD